MRKGSCTTVAAITPSFSALTSLSSLSKPTSFTLSWALDSAIAWIAPWAWMRFEADDLHGLGGLVDRLAERGALGRRDHDGGGLGGDGVLEDRDLAVDVGLGLGAELGHLDAEVLPGLAGAGQHDLPVEGGRVL